MNSSKPIADAVQAVVGRLVDAERERSECIAQLDAAGVVLTRTPMGISWSFCCLCGREGHLSKDCKWGRA